MKKQNVVATLGTLALVANLLLPGMAFGQSDAQLASQNIACPARGANPAFEVTLADVTFDPKTSSPTVTYDSYDNALTPQGDLPVDHLLGISDARSGNVDGCPEGSTGWSVAVASTNLINGSYNIPNSTLRIITSNEVDTTGHTVVAPGSSPGQREALYGVADGAGNRMDVDSPLLYDDSERDFAEENNFFEKKSNYTNARAIGDSPETSAVGEDATGTAFSNSLNASRTILNSPTAKNESVYTGVALFIDQGIAPNQAPGTYTGTVTYTLTAS